MKVEDFAKIHRSKAGKSKVICYEINNPDLLLEFFKELGFKPALLASRLGIHYQSCRKLLQDAGFWKYVSVKNGKGSGINRKRMRVTNINGYPYSEKVDSYTLKNGRSRRKLKHIEVAEEMIGRSLSNLENVHHIDGDKLNNDANNLAVLSKSEHGKAHASLENVAMQLVKNKIIMYNKTSNRYYLPEEK